MFRIRRVYDVVVDRDASAVAHVQNLLTERIPGIQQEFVEGIVGKLHDPVGHRFRTILYVAEDGHAEVAGFALASYDPSLKFCFLDYLVASELKAGRGVGGALYRRVREEAARLSAVGIFFECLPDDPALCSGPELLRENSSRLKFYERYGARPIVGTRYETPVKAGDSCPPYLVFDSLAPDAPESPAATQGLRRSAARSIVRAILERTYPHFCPPEYIDAVVESFRDDPVRVREPKYTRRTQKSHSTKIDSAPAFVPRNQERIALAVTDSHRIHHIRERGYVESPVRIPAILDQLRVGRDFYRVPIRHFSDKYLRRIHDKSLLSILQESRRLKPDQSAVYPYVFPVRHPDRPPADYTVRAGYYCIDTFTPLHANVWPAARRAVDCALTAADLLSSSDARLAYALVRPPGHHAERRVFGGFCYLNSTAATAEYLTRLGHVAILDLDFHHGNGQQDIFYDRRDVLTVSIHGHPKYQYPYFAGFNDELGDGEGIDYNRNYPIIESLDGDGYRRVLRKALSYIREFDPDALVVALGLDTARGDPTGNFLLRTADFRENGLMVGSLGIPTAVVQEGGYDTRVIGANAQAFFDGLRTGFALSTPYLRT